MADRALLHRRFVVPGVMLLVLVSVTSLVLAGGSSSTGTDSRFSLDQIGSTVLSYTSSDTARLGKRTAAVRRVAVEPELRALELCLVVLTHDAEASYLPLSLLSLAQVDVPTRAFLINTGSDPRLTPELVEASRTVNSLVGDADWSRFVDVPHGKDIVVERSDEGYVIPATKHSATYDFDGVDAVLAKLYDQQEQTCTHILVTHGTDTYNRHLGSYLKEGLTDAHFDMIAFDTVSRARVGSPVIVLGDRVRIANIGEWKQFETSFSVGNVELGSVIFRYDFLRANRFLFRDFGAYNDRSDAYMIAGASRLANESYIARAVMYMKQ